MTSAIQGPPNTYDAGYDFNYAQWTADTTLTLCNVPWNNDYRDIVRFTNQAALDTYINNLPSPTTAISNASYAKLNMPVRIDMPFNQALKYNYIRATNPAQPISGDVARSFYYFITAVNYIAPNTTEIVVQLDVIQSFGYGVTFGRCYVDRGHIGVANTNAMNNYGRDYLAIPEGLDTGAEYRTIHVEQPNHSDWMNWSVVVVSTIDLKANAGDANNPVQVTASGGVFFGLPMGASVYVLKDYQGLSYLMGYLSDKPWVSQGIISITVVPNFSLFYPGFSIYAYGEDSNTDIQQLSLAPNGPGTTLDVAGLANWRTNSDIQGNIPTRYQGLNKFYTAPYMMIEVTNWMGTPIMLRPENWNDPDAALIIVPNYAPPDQRVVIMPHNYNASITDASSDGRDDKGDFLDTATTIGDFPTTAVVNNMAIQYLAANKNSIAFQYSSADWSQQRALQSASTSYGQASYGIATGNALTGNANSQATRSQGIANKQQILNAVSGATVGVAGGIASGGLGASEAIGMLGQAAQTGENISAANQQVALGNSFRSANNSLVQSQAGYNRDTNNALAVWAANGDYENAIAGINAKVQDSRLTQPSVSGQLGGSSFNVVHQYAGPSVRWKMLDPAALTVIGEYWLRYGYSVRRFIQMPATWQVMSKFTYWKLLETYITAGNMPEEFKQAIRGIFEKGVTVWADPSYIGTTDAADNTPLGGISF